MDDKTLAEKLVSLEAITADGEGYHRRYHLPVDSGMQGVPEFMAHQIVTDPRVAMALMERCDALHYWKLSNWRVDARTEHSNLTGAQGDSLPRAIIEAAVKALEAN